MWHGSLSTARAGGGGGGEEEKGPPSFSDDHFKTSLLNTSPKCNLPFTAMVIKSLSTVHQLLLRLWLKNNKVDKTIVTTLPQIVLHQSPLGKTSVCGVG